MLKTAFNSESWLTEDTQVLTTSGWVPITEVELGAKVLGQVNGRYQEDTVYSVGKCFTSTIIKEYKETLFAKNICFKEDQAILNVQKYTGQLINLKTRTNTLIVRCIRYFEDILIHNDDYHIIWTAK